MLLTDAYGANGGIAQYNRDFLQALCSYPQSAEVVAIPRLVSQPIGNLPKNLTYVMSGINGKWRYARAVFKTVFMKPGFDLVICGHIHLLVLAILARIFSLRSPLFLLLYGVDAWKPSRHRVANRLVGRVNGIISISEISLKRFLKWTNVKLTRFFLLPPAVDLKSFSGNGMDHRTSLRQRYSLDGKTVLMSLARLSAEDRYKGIDEILDLMPSLLQKIPNVAYLIAGDGTDRRRLEEKVQSLNLQSFVTFTGHVDESEKADHYRLADVFVMPGWGEGFGIVYLEAMASGVPVIASKVDGSREATRNGLLGALVDPASPHEIETAVLQAIQQTKGIVPDGLDYFSFDQFEMRCHQMLDKVCAPSLC